MEKWRGNFSKSTWLPCDWHSVGKSDEKCFLSGERVAVLRRNFARRLNAAAESSTTKMDYLNRREDGIIGIVVKMKGDNQSRRSELSKAKANDVRAFHENRLVGFKNFPEN